MTTRKCDKEMIKMSIFKSQEHLAANHAPRSPASDPHNGIQDRENVLPNNSIDADLQQTISKANIASPSTISQKLSRTRTELAYLTFIFGASATGVIESLLVLGFSIVAADLNINLTQVALLNGFLVMALGVSAYVCNALLTVIGTRFIYLLTRLLLIVTWCWGAAAKSYGSLIAARVFQGWGMGSWFSIGGTTSLTSMFAVHERGRRVGIWNLAVICSVNLAPVISAQLIVALDWRWAFWTLAFLFGMVLIMTLVALPEAVPELQAIVSILDQAKDSLDKEQTVAVTGSPTTDVQPRIVISHAPSWKRVFGIDDYALVTPKTLFKALISPISLLIPPILLWGCAMWSVVFSWTIIQGAVADQIWEAPSWNLSPIAVGNLVDIAPLIGSLLGCILGGMMCDLLAQ